MLDFETGNNVYMSIAQKHRIETYRRYMLRRLTEIHWHHLLRLLY